jgi:hypothetical protein
MTSCHGSQQPFFKILFLVAVSFTSNTRKHLFAASSLEGRMIPLSLYVSLLFLCLSASLPLSIVPPTAVTLHTAQLARLEFKACCDATMAAQAPDATHIKPPLDIMEKLSSLRALSTFYVMLAS